MKGSTEKGAREGAEVGHLEVLMASSFAVAGPTILRALWAEDMRYLERSGWEWIAVAWALGVLLSAFPLITGYRLWRQTGRVKGSEISSENSHGSATSTR